MSRPLVRHHNNQQQTLLVVCQAVTIALYSSYIRTLSSSSPSTATSSSYSSRSAVPLPSGLKVFNLYSLAVFCFWDRIPFPEAPHPTDRKLRPFGRPPVLSFLALPTESIHHHNPLSLSVCVLSSHSPTKGTLRIWQPASSTRPQGLVITFTPKKVDPRVVGQHFSHRRCRLMLQPACLYSIYHAIQRQNLLTRTNCC